MRRVRTALGWLITRALVAWLCLAVTLAIVGAITVAYRDLTGPHCGSRAMSPGDTCSTVWAHGGRRTRQAEQLNSPGAAPAVLTLPGVAPERLHRGVYNTAGMADYHRSEGVGALVFAVLLTLVPATWVMRAVRSRGRANATE
ncbi:hypothetical protein [Mycolicibacterium sp. CBMA 226]|uniref:hypothetical protein n=1 Tax=Mycolicibacterium sp. CBMA 226 TaxID=2606611 RepID=UPI0012DEE4A6|nr:hypothetical protein [Mycolicibacterium sp. CBMA 226]MUL78888.1 hypothetical protein [Mycolicibacterium sp. CBMA 226]